MSSILPGSQWASFINCPKCAWTYSGLTNLCVGFLRQQWIPNWITCTFLSHKGEPSLIKTMWLMTPTLMPKEDKSPSQSLCCIGSCPHYSVFNTSSAEVKELSGDQRLLLTVCYCVLLCIVSFVSLLNMWNNMVKQCHVWRPKCWYLNLCLMCMNSENIRYIFVLKSGMSEALTF